MPEDRDEPPRGAGPVAFVPPAEFEDEVVTDPTAGSTLTVAEQAELLTALRQVQAKELDPLGCRRVLVDSAVKALHADLGWLSLINRADQSFTVVHSVGLEASLSEVRTQSVSGVGAEAARRRATLIVNDFPRSTRTPPEVRGRLIAAGVRSLICTPLIAGELIGLLCVARRGPRRLTHRDSVLIGTLAAQGAMTIDNGDIFAELRHQTHSLRGALSVGAHVHECLLAGGGLAGAARTLASALGRGVSIHQSVVAEEPGWYAPDGSPLTRPPPAPTVQIDLVAAGEILGTIQLDGERPPDAVQERTVDVASTAIVSELLARRRSEESQWRLHGELLAELVSVPAPLPRPLAIRARRRGVDLTTATVVVLARDRSRRETPSLLLEARAALRARVPHGTAVLAFGRGRSVVLALPPGAATRADVAAITADLEAHGRVRGGVGRAGDHHGALRQADACLALAASSTRADVVDVHDLGLFGLLVEAGPHRPVVESIRRILGPVHEADQDLRVPLLPTLEALCVAEGRIEAAARLLNVHESTLRYRLARLREVIDLSGGPARLLELRVALESLNVVRATGWDPFAEPQG